MKQIPRPFIIIVVLFFIAFGLGLGLRYLLVPEKPDVPAVVTKAEPPEFPSPVVTGQPRYVVSQKQDFPPRMSSYTVTGGVDVGDVTDRVGKSLNLTGSPRPSSGSQGIYYYWNTDAASLTVGGEPVNIAYAVQKDLAGVITREEEVLSRGAAEYLSSLGLPQEPMTLRKTDSVFMNPEKQDPRPVGSISDATLIQLGFQYVLEGRPVIFHPPSVPGAAVQMNAAGEVGSFRAARLPDVVKGADMEVIAYDEAVRRLMQRQGVLASVETVSATNEFYLTKPPDISTIYKTELGYFYSPNQKSLAPVFIFYGKGVRDSLSLKTITLVSAAPENITP